MKVILKQTANERKLVDLAPGEFFIFENEGYIVLEDAPQLTNGTEDGCSAVALRTGEIFVLYGNTTVIVPYKVKTIVDSANIFTEL